ncbi:MAG: M42 family metallopeptidase [Bacilli bacterium]|jgi:glutamyl aminopeptidase
MSLTPRQLELFEKYTQIDGIAGQEEAVHGQLRRAYTELGLEIIEDHLGSIVGRKKTKTKNPLKVMVVAHMDEVGFMVTEITKNGMLKCDPVGGVNPQTLLSSRVRLKIGKDQFLHGSIDAIPPHLMKEEDRTRPVQVKEMLFDFGFTTDEEAKKTGVKIGQMIVVEGSLRVLNNGKRILSKAFDNRYGVVLGLDILEALQDEELPIDLYVGATVQEEVGVRGAMTLTHKIQPDFAIVLDCSPARDSTGSKTELGQLGEGILLRYFDRSMIAFPELIDYQLKAAQATGVKYQYFDSPGGTDAGAIHLKHAGVLTLTHCICARNIHTCSSIIDVEDYLAAKKTLLYMLRDLNRDKFEAFLQERR